MSSPRSLQLIGSRSMGGAERWFLRFVRALADEGAPVQAAVRAGSELAAQDFGELPVHTLPFATVWDPWSRGSLQRLIRRIQPDLVQTYMGRATRLTRTRGIPHIARLGGYYALHPYRHADAWIGNTKGLCDWMIQQGLPARRVYPIYNFVEPVHPMKAAQLAQFRQRLGLPSEAWLLLSAGRFVPVKGFSILFEALGRLPREIAGRPWRLLLLGKGQLEAALRRQARENDLEPVLFWAGWQDDPGPFFQLADLVVFPSLEAETLGNVILEAWAWAKPLVTSHFRGAREITRHGEDAWCVPCEAPKALAQGIQTVLEDEDLRKVLAAQGWKRVQREFSRAAILQQYLQLYDRLAG